MQEQRSIRLVTALVVLATALGAGGEPATRLSLDPASLRLAPGETRLVAVRVSGVPEPGLAAFQVTLEFDPRAVQVDDPNGAATGSGVPTFAPLGGSPLCAAVRGEPRCTDPEWMLAAGGRQPFGTARLDNAAGRVTIGFATAGSAAPPSGDGALALLRVTATGGGRTGLRIVDAILADPSDPPRRYAVEDHARPTPAAPGKPGPRSRR